MPSYLSFARFYDGLMQDACYEKRCDYILKLAESFGHDMGITLDLACGTGTLTRLLKKRGVDVFGIDYSMEMLSEAMQSASEEGLDILFLRQKMQSIDLYGTINTCVCTLDSINHLTKIEDVAKTFDRVGLFMDDDGLFVFDVNTVYKHKNVLADNTFVYENDSVFCVWQNTPEDDNKVKIVYMREIADRIYFDTALEDDIQNKIVSEDEVSDYASDALYTIRRSIRSLNEKIRAKLSAYLTGGDSKYLQDGVVTMRDNRYVLPVRAEYKSKIKGFVHDRSQSGATFFIEPEYVLELNNELRTLMSDEKEEVERILLQLSNRVGAIYEKLKEDIDRLSELDRCYAKAEYSYKNKCVRPRLNARGVIDIVKGRHPLLDAKTAIPVSVSLGDKYDLLLISGPNTGGKTVTLKMCGLFCLMACCGIFIPASGPSTVAVFENIFCDIGDSQSIEENLSTFSSHVKNVIEITENADKNSLVLIDELGGGTDPDEGQAIAKAVISYLLSLKSKGIITTHYSSLKEFAYSTDGIENASMEFDMTTLQPLYRIR